MKGAKNKNKKQNNGIKLVYFDPFVKNIYFISVYFVFNYNFNLIFQLFY